MHIYKNIHIQTLEITFRNDHERTGTHTLSLSYTHTHTHTLIVTAAKLARTTAPSQSPKNAATLITR